MLCSCTATVCKSHLSKSDGVQVLISLEVEQKPFVSDTFGGFQRQYWMRLHCHPMESFPPELELTFEEVADTFTKQFLPKLKVGRVPLNPLATLRRSLPQEVISSLYSEGWSSLPYADACSFYCKDTAGCILLKRGSLLRCGHHPHSRHCSPFAVCQAESLENPAIANRFVVASGCDFSRYVAWCETRPVLA